MENRMKLKTVRYESRIAEVDAVADQIILAYDEVDLSVDTNLTNIMGVVRSDKDNLEIAIQQTDAESDLAEKDDVRDGKFRAVGYILQGAVYNPQASIKDAAVPLHKIYDKYGMDTVNKSYNEESSNITNIIEEYKTPESQENAAKIPGFTKAIEELDESQDDFNKAVIKWQTDKGNDKAKVNASSEKKELMNCLNKKFIPYLDVMNGINSELYGSFANAVAEIINDNNENVKRRQPVKDS
jgi:hypothetical protein